MSDKTEIQQQIPTTESEEAASTMSSIEEPTTQKKPLNISFSIWPPTQRTRDAVIHRLIETLTTPSILAKRYGTVPQDEATETAKRIEEEAFAAAGSSALGDDDGVEILQVYSKEISKRMLDAVKSRSVNEPDTKPVESPENAEPEPAAPAASVDNES